MNALEKIAIEKLKSQLYDLKKDVNEASDYKDTNGSDHGLIAIQKSSTINKIDRAIETIIAIEFNDEFCQRPNK